MRPSPQLRQSPRQGGASPQFLDAVEAAGLVEEHPALSFQQFSQKPRETMPLLHPDPSSALERRHQELRLGLWNVVLSSIGRQHSVEDNLGRLRRLVREIVESRRRARRLWRAAIAYGAGDWEEAAVFWNVANHMKERQVHVKEFFTDYRPSHRRHDLPTAQVVDSPLAFLETHGRFWYMSEATAGNAGTPRAGRRISASKISLADKLPAVSERKQSLVDEPPAGGNREDSKQSWSLRSARARHTKRSWPLAQRLMEGIEETDRHAGLGPLGQEPWGEDQVAVKMHDPSIRFGQQPVENHGSRRNGRWQSGAPDINTAVPNLISSGRVRDPVDAAKDNSDHTPRCTVSLPPIMATTFNEQKKQAVQSVSKRQPNSSGQRAPGPVPGLRRYMMACAEKGILPTPQVSFSGNSLKLNAQNGAMDDSDLFAVTVSLRGLKEVSEIDLSGNTLISDKALMPFLSKLFGKPASGSLQALSLRSLRAGKDCMNLVVELIAETNGLTSLKRLDLGGISMSWRCQLDLCKAVGEHSALQYLSLADTGLGSNPDTKKCLKRMLQCVTLRCLDLSWNPFGDEVFEAIGQNLAEPHIYIDKLNLSNCSSTSGKTKTDTAETNPANIMLEYLCQDAQLTSLDISMNRLDLTGALLLEDVLSTHPSLVELDVSHNLFSALGAHSILRLFAVSKLRELHCTQCFGEASVDPQQPLFQRCSPDGHYDLDLCKPYHRTMLRMLCKFCFEVGLRLSEAFEGFSSSAAIVLPEKSIGRGVLQIPCRGNVQFLFSTTTEASPDIFEEPVTNIEAMLCKRIERGRLRLPFDKAVLLMILFDRLGSREYQEILLDVLAADFWLDFSHVQHLCCVGHNLAPAAVTRLYHCVGAAPMLRRICLLLTANKNQYALCSAKLQNFLDFTASNPSGHYSLSVGSASDFHVLECLRILDCWETASALRRGFVDTSQRGNNSQIRNEKFNGQAYPFWSITTWRVPTHGNLELDYSGGQRPQRGSACMLTDKHFEDFLGLRSAGFNGQQQIKALRNVAQALLVTTLQLRKILGSIFDRDVRLDAFLVFYFRLADIWNLKVCTARFSSEECLTLQERLGHVNFFPFVQPEQNHFELDLSVPDQRLAASIWVKLSLTEGCPLSGPSFVCEDGFVDKLDNRGTPPQAWSSLAGCPKAGIFHGSYLAAPGQRSLKKRLELLRSHGRWPMLDKELQVQDVSWCSSLGDTPDCMIRFVEVIRRHHASLSEAFIGFGGDETSGMLEFSQFEQACEKSSGDLFKGNTVIDVFEYLNASGSGAISKEEWLLLDSIASELDKHASELHQFFLRRFGGLQEAWEALEEEWRASLDKWGYFGLSRKLFVMLDSSQTGALKFEDFSRIVRDVKSTV
eukprot:TRINITY_DN12882_c0_g1_i1.p1 TRINITY_DN12882_c0_g1~~TRINITY_DN12882_c0_g1_i1.p1  ORF type:complete len:1373 (+),score=239.44 TRINITY_DN12882_c0_g1_i1:206-4324(+)